MRRSLCSTLLLAALLGPASADRDSMGSGGAHVVVDLRHAAVVVEPTRRDAGERCSVLKPEELTIRLGSASLPVLSLGPRPGPRLHAVLLDTSHSMMARLPMAHRAIEAYLAALPAGDRAIVAVFDDELRLVSPRAPAERLDPVALGRFGSGHRTALWEAVHRLLAAVRHDRAEKIVVLITDGDDSGSAPEYTFQSTSRLVTRIPDLVLFALGIDPPRESSVGVATARGRLRSLALSTGGEFVEIGGLAGIHDALLRVRDRLASRRYVAWLPEPARGVEKLRIEARAPCRVRALGTPDLGSGRPAPTGRATFRELDDHERAAIERRPCGRIPGAPVPLERIVLPPVDRAGEPRLARGWFARAPEGSALRGAVFDVVRAGGTLFDTHRSPGENRRMHLAIPRRAERAWRSIEIASPPVGRLLDELRGPEAVVEYLLLHDTRADDACGESSDPTPAWRIEGTTFLDLRDEIGRALHAAHDDYRQWASRRAEADAIGEFDRLYEFVTPDAVRSDPARLAARASYASAAADPDSGRPHRWLSAWLGDVPAAEVVERLERSLVERLLTSGEETPSHELARAIAARWGRLAAWFPAAANVRVVVPLVPAFDPSRVAIGFYRFLLPSPSVDRRPVFVRDRPVAFELALALAAQAGSRPLLARGLRVGAIRYVEAGAPELRTPTCPGEREARQAVEIIVVRDRDRRSMRLLGRFPEAGAVLPTCFVVSNGDEPIVTPGNRPEPVLRALTAFGAGAD